MSKQERSQEPLATGSGTPPGQPQGASTGGIGRTADSAIRESQQAPDRVAGIEPAAGASGAPPGPSSDREALDGTRGGPTAVPEQGPDRGEDPPGREEESPAESLGRAIGAPLSGEAGEHEPRR